MSPRPVQRPRPPITLAGQSPSVLKVAARRADCWNTHGPFDATAEETLNLTARQNRTLDGLCAEQGREPGEVRRSLLLLGPLDAWSSSDALERIVEQFAAVGMREFVVFWPPDDRRALLERAANHVLPDLRG